MKTMQMRGKHSKALMPESKGLQIDYTEAQPVRHNDIVICVACGKEQGVQVVIEPNRAAFFTCKHVSCGCTQMYVPSNSAKND